MYLHWLWDSFIEATQVCPARQAEGIKVEGTEVGLQTVLWLTHAVVQDTEEGWGTGGRERKRERGRGGGEGQTEREREREREREKEKEHMNTAAQYSQTRQYVCMYVCMYVNTSIQAQKLRGVVYAHINYEVSVYMDKKTFPSTKEECELSLPTTITYGNRTLAPQRTKQQWK